MKSHAEKVRTAELLFTGATLGSTGLFLSLAMLLFRSSCDTTHYMPTRMVHNQTGNEVMCKNSPTYQIAEKYSDPTDTRIVTVVGSSCKIDSDCMSSVGPDALCLGGPDNINQVGYCNLPGSECKCSNFVHECGFMNHFAYTFKPSDILLGCVGAGCNVSRTKYIKYWKEPAYTRKMPIGCEAHQRTKIGSVIRYLQREMQAEAIFKLSAEMTHSVLKPEVDPVWNFLKAKLSEVVEPLEYNYFWPSTISESVSVQSSPASHIFLGFMLLGSLCLFISNYTFDVESVDLGNRLIHKTFFPVQVNTVRQLLPPIGLILLALVPMKPANNMFNLCDVLMTAVHLIGAQFCFVAYLVCEALSLVDKKNVKEMYPNEKKIRMFMCGTGIVAMGLFGLCYGILTLFTGGNNTPYVMWPFGGLNDMFRLDTVTSLSHLVRPAEGFWKTLKIMSYVAEFVVAFMLLANLLVIWYFYQLQLRTDGFIASRVDEEDEEFSDEESMNSS